MLATKGMRFPIDVILVCIPLVAPFHDLTAGLYKEAPFYYYSGW